MSLPSASHSWFVRLHAGDAGIDPYTRAVSDVYQDLFQEGSFIGKGIYEVDAFERALAGRFPENTILSHDLLESVYARCALVSDVKFYEEYPSRYLVDVGRRHRWIRGDWQIMPWLLPWVPGRKRRRIANPLSALSWWKIFDNLRRSLVPGCAAPFPAGELAVRPGLRRLGNVACPRGSSLLPGLLSVLRRSVAQAGATPVVDAPAGSRRHRLVAATRPDLRSRSRSYPTMHFVSLNAIGRTLLRMLVTRKRLLEWRTLERRCPDRAQRISPAFMPRCGLRRPSL